MDEGQKTTRVLIAQNLKKYRQKKGLTIREAGDLLGKSNQTISAWEQGRGQPDAEMFLKLCEIYEVPSVSLFFGEQQPEPELTIDERELLEDWRHATDAAKQSALMVLKANRRPVVKKEKAM